MAPPLPRGSQNFSFLVNPSTASITTYSDCLICAQGKQKMFEEIVHFHHMTYDRAIAQELLPWGHENYNFGISFSCHQYFLFSIFDICQGGERKIFKEITSILHFYSKIITLLRVGIMKLTIVHLLIFIQNLLRLNQQFFKRRC